MTGPFQAVDSPNKIEVRVASPVAASPAPTEKEHASRTNFARWLRWRMYDAPGQFGDLARSLDEIDGDEFVWNIFPRYQPSDWPVVVTERGWKTVDTKVLMLAWQHFTEDFSDDVIYQ